MTADQRDRLLGQLAQGVTPSTACAALGVDPACLLDYLSVDRTYALAYFAVVLQRDALDAALQMGQQ
jgi:hypothetical protein